MLRSSRKIDPAGKSLECTDSVLGFPAVLQQLVQPLSLDRLFVFGCVHNTLLSPELSNMLGTK